LVVALCALALSGVLVPAARGDSAVISAVDAGSGQMRATVEVTSTTCGTFGYCGWFAVGVERHSSLPCRFDEGMPVGLIPLQEASGTARAEWTFPPFFPRLDKLCVYIEGGAGQHLAGEALLTLPTGYGRQRSSGYNCSSFANQQRAEYYLELYPDDPSRLDADHDGSACESNRCPCGAEPIPAEPAPAPIAAPTVTPSAGPSAGTCEEGHRRVVAAWARVTAARQRFRLARGTRTARLKHQALTRRLAEARQTEQQQIELCGYA
jgi:hypothetical protein